MRVEDLIFDLKAAQYSAMEEAFKSPPADFAQFQKRLGFWLGLSECLRRIEDLRKKDINNDE